MERTKQLFCNYVENISDKINNCFKLLSVNFEKLGMKMKRPSAIPSIC